VAKRYTLFLDESETHKHDKVIRQDSDYHFCMAGVIVAEDDYAHLQNSLNQLKKSVWPELPNPERVILHQMRLIDAEKGRLDISKYPEYAKFSRRSERKKFYDELKKIFVNNRLTIVGSSINEDNLKQYYWVTGKNKQDQYLVAMQLLLENYCHFLCMNNAMGKIIYEYRELIGNERLTFIFYWLRVIG